MREEKQRARRRDPRPSSRGHGGAESGPVMQREWDHYRASRRPSAQWSPFKKFDSVDKLRNYETPGAGRATRNNNARARNSCSEGA